MENICILFKYISINKQHQVSKYNNIRQRLELQDRKDK